ncbi:coiled-coil domain-containing protein 57 isoform X2 [Myripristis murdjan]|uniref:Coiled-coil domain containing 57 n=2 Tax=Myripristis murdjan TaxID=586833 RepID=A0A667WHC2_9TELE|nr:coiled-coil domain-containing protein 57 isoform X2 [Myripristis murdjan]
MQAAGAGALGDLEAQLASKEREWKELQCLRVQQLEASLREAQEELSSLRKRFQQLREDFRFNLAVLEERDRELERYDAVTARALTVENNRQEELSQLRVQVATLEEQRAREAKEREEELRVNQQRAAQHRLQLEELQSSMAGDIQKQREEFERMKWDLQRRTREVEGELALQRQEMTADFDKELRLREHEFNLKMDEMRAVVLSHELKVKLLSKETQVHSQAQLQAEEALKASEELCQQLQSQLQHRVWEIKDLTAVKDNRIKELEDKLKRMETKLKKDEDNHIKKHEYLDRAMRERDAQLEAQRQAHTEQLQRSEEQMVKLQEDSEVMAAQARRAQKDHEEALEQRDDTIHRLRTELETTRASWDKYISQASKETVARDTEMLALQEREAKQKLKLESSREEMERYKQQLSAGLEREKALEQMRVQTELEWQRRCEDSKAEHYLASEQLIQGLTQARDQAEAELRERDRELQDLTVLLRSVTKERDQALQGFSPNVGDLVSEELRRLQQQNSSLRAVVAQMRKDMEGVSQLPHPPQPQASPPQPPGAAATSTTSPASNAQMTTAPSAQPAASSSKPSPTATVTAEYTQALEQEVVQLKARCRHLEGQLEGTTGLLNPTIATDKPSEALAPVAPDNGYLRNHIRSLNETIGGLRMEKVANTAAFKKQEVRVAHLETALTSLTQQCHTKQVEAEELRLELANQRRRWASEEAGLRQRLATVEMELEEVRREKEEYQKGNVLNNLETVALGNQVSALKIDIASRREPIVCEQSEMVRQLQEENLYLRQQQQLAFGLKSGGALEDYQGGKPNAPLLQTKLKQAAHVIARLSREKQQLIEMGNRLRAQITAAGLQVSQSSVRPKESMEPERDSSRETQGDQHGRLSALEQLQYRLTSQELQYAQRQGASIVLQPLLSEPDSRDRGKNRTANPWAQGHQDTAKPEHPSSKESAPSALSQSQSSFHPDMASVPPSSPSGPLLSSVASEGSLREVWKMLDRGLSPSVLTEGEEELSRRDLAEPSSLGVQVRVQGVKIQSQERRKPTRMPSHPTKLGKPGGPGRVSKIRNYNIKD